jgi:predicted outer membrane protein
MIDTIKALKIRARTANRKELEAIDLEMDRLALENPKAFSEAMLAAANQTSVALDKLILKDKLEKILPIISVSYLSKNYFKKTPQWFYQRLNGNLVNGKEARFTVSEVQILSNALKEIGQKLSTSANLIL